MEEGYSGQQAANQYFLEIAQRLRDLEDRQKILSEKVMLATKTVIEERKKNFSDIQDLKRVMSDIKAELEKSKATLRSLTEHASGFARREELMIIQRQLDLLRSKNGKA